MAEAERIQAAVAEFQKTQTEFDNVVDLQQQLLSQLTESREVRKELDNLPPGNQVYKRLGPVLLPQDATDAKDNVTKRLEFIEKELERVEGQLKLLSEKRDSLRFEIGSLQQKQQAK
ncbi:Prefoldin subunit 6 [Malassezia cuniculi]|uniref:Prefoldin subunit 6 n=1 Tax=Malassezia cuniculi TaxID=948313 RepID=A0AAF0EZ54_9BASI|nr:Prefoldin subunit 6 [Malassezia cuniculi]